MPSQTATATVPHAESAVLATPSAKCNVVGLDSLLVITVGGCIGIVALELNVINFLRLDRFSVDGPLVNPRRPLNLESSPRAGVWDVSLHHGRYTSPREIHI